MGWNSAFGRITACVSSPRQRNLEGFILGRFTVVKNMNMAVVATFQQFCIYLIIFAYFFVIICLLKDAVRLRLK